MTSAARPRFASQGSTQTLAQGLAEYHAVHRHLKRDASLSKDAARFFHCHDVVHVLYGCGTSMPDEAIVKLASLFGTTAGLSALRGYRLNEARDVYSNLPIQSTLIALLLSPYLVVRTIWRCRRQTARWPWEPHERYMHIALDRLRRRFRIRVAHAWHP